MSTQVIVLAAGQGKRLNSTTLPKVLVLLNSKPIVSYLLDEISKLPNLPKPIIVVGFHHQLVEESLGNGYIYALQEQQLGTGHAVKQAKGLVGSDNVLVLYGDMPFIKASNIQQLILSHNNFGGVLSLCTAVVPNFSGMYKSMQSYGRIVRDSNNRILRITEFKDANEKERNILEVNPGIYMFNSVWLWKNIEKLSNNNSQGEYYLTDLIELAIKDGVSINTFSVPPEEVFGINTEEDLVSAENYLNKI